MRVVTLDQLSGDYADMARRAMDLNPVTKVGGIMGLGEVKSRFQSQTDPAGVPWIPLRHARPEGGSLVLRNHGILGASWTYESDESSWKVGTNHKAARTHQFGKTIVPVNVQWLTIPITKTAVYAGRATNMSGLHFRKRKDQEGSAGLYDSDGVKHWHLTKKIVIPARRMAGVSDELMERWLFVLVQYLTTGEL